MTSLPSKSWFLRLVFALVILTACSAALAQLGTGQIEGTISDPSGAVIPGATVTIRNLDTGSERVLTTDSGGRYRAVALPPGPYSVKVEHTGFQPLERSGLNVVVGTTISIDLTLEVKAVAEAVTVTEAAPVVEPEKTEVASTVRSEMVQNLPVLGRRWDNYVFLTPGVSPDGTFGLITYRGISGLYNNNTIDGADNNQAFFSEARGRTRVVYTYSQAVVKEFQVGLSNFNAEYGRAAGGMVNAVTKSGTNTFHGEAFYYLRDDFTSAREPTIDTAIVRRALGTDKLPERRQQFGFAMGGPVKKDKVFWFLAYDQQHRTFPYVVNASDPAFPVTNCAAQATVNRVATCSFFEAEATVVSRKALNNVAFGRIDWQMNQNHNLAVYYNFHKWRSPNGIRTPLLNQNAASDNGFDGVRTDSLYFRLNSVLTSSLVNEARFQFARDNEFQRPNAPGPGTSVTGGFTFGQPNFLPRLAFPFEKRYQIVDNVSKIHGRHTFKVGADINYVRETQINLFQGGGVYSYSSFNNMALDCPPGAIAFGCVPSGTFNYSSFTEAFDLRVISGALPRERSGFNFFTNTNWNFYAQDTWKLSPDLTINYGIRYEYQRLPQPFQANPAFPLTGRFNQDKNNWGPRLGIAWDIGGRHKTILRAGYGLIYGLTSNSAISSAMTDNGVVVATFSFTSTSNAALRPLYPNCFLPGVNANCAITLGAPTGAAPDIRQLSADFARPLIHQAQFSLEHEIFKDTVISATYAFSGGRRLPIFRDVNIPPPGNVFFINLPTALPLLIKGITTRLLVPAGLYGPFPFYCVDNATAPAGNCPAGYVRPFTGANRVLEADSVANSGYNGLILRMTRRMSRGVLFDAHFTWAKAIDSGQNSLTFFPTSSTNFDPLNNTRDRSLSNFDIRKRFVGVLVWQPEHTWEITGPVKKKVLGGWTFSGVLTLQDGFPVTGTLSGFLTAGNTRPIDTGSSNGSGGNFRFPFVPRNAFKGPGFNNLDFRISRSVSLGERYRVELIVESFNIMNRVNFQTVNTTAFSLTSNVMNVTSCGGVPITLGNRCLTASSSSTFMVPRSASSTYNTPREFQFALRFFW